QHQRPHPLNPTHTHIDTQMYTHLRTHHKKATPYFSFKSVLILFSVSVLLLLPLVVFSHIQAHTHTHTDSSTDTHTHTCINTYNTDKCLTECKTQRCNFSVTLSTILYFCATGPYFRF